VGGAGVGVDWALPEAIVLLPAAIAEHKPRAFSPLSGMTETQRPYRTILYFPVISAPLGPETNGISVLGEVGTAPER
jgi:hypothetical protein